MKAFLFFALFFLSVTNDLHADIEYQKNVDLQEYTIPDEKGKCLLHYFSKTMPDKTLRLIIDDEDCLERGFHSAKIINAKNETVYTLNGFFIDGFFIKETPLNTPVQKRGIDNQGTQILIYAIEDFPNENISYNGQMALVWQDDGFAYFDACQPFHVIIQSPLDKITPQMVEKAQLYASLICPQATQLQIDLFNRFSFLHPYVHQMTFNNIDEEWVDDEKKALTLADPFVLLEMAQDTQQPQKGFFIIHITDRGGNGFSFTDEPFIMKTSTALAKGWYLVQGDLQPLSKFEKKKSGISLRQPAANLNIFKSLSCQDARCQTFLNQRHQ